MLGNVEKLLANLRNSSFFLYTQTSGGPDDEVRYAIARLVTGLGELREDSRNRGLDFELTMERLENTVKRHFSVGEFSGARRPSFESLAKKVFINRDLVTAHCGLLGVVNEVPHFYCTITAFRCANPPAVIGRSLDETLFKALEEADSFFLRSA